jgi:hypothetical protein
MCRLLRPALAMALLCWSSTGIAQIAPITTCDRVGIGSVRLEADAPVTILSVTEGIASSEAADAALASTASPSVQAGSSPAPVPYCLVKIRIPQAIHIWVGLPMKGTWNGRLQSEGTGGFAGLIEAPVRALLGGYVGVQSDSGHAYDLAEGVETLRPRLGDFGMAAPGAPNPALQKDFAVRSVHLMAVIGKQLTQAFYGRPPMYSYWNGCSTGGRQGLRMAQEFPGDYDGILAGAPAIHWDRFQASQLWPQVVMKDLVGGVVSIAKQELATRAAIASCDASDGVLDGVITDPRECAYSARSDRTITTASCASTNDTCLSPGEAAAIDRIWEGATNARGELLWPGPERGAPLKHLAGPAPNYTAINQARFWVYLDPQWNWRTLTLENYGQFFEKARQMVGPLMASDDPDLTAFRARGGKIIAWHGFNDPGITPRGTIRYYERVVQFFDIRHSEAQQFFRLFLAPGVEHCGRGNGPQPQDLFSSLERWVERDQAPDWITASQPLSGGAVRTRPLCPYPAFAKYRGSGSTDDAFNFVCAMEPWNGGGGSSVQLRRLSPDPERK